MANKRAKVLKRCVKCGRTTLALPRERRCKHQPFGPKSYCCWGKLQRVQRASRAVVEKPEDVSADGIPGSAATEAVVAARRPQAVAQVKLEHARSQMKKAASRIKRATTSLNLWQKRAERYARLASMTDEEYAAQRADQQSKAEARAQRKRRSRRSIDLTE